MDSTNPPQQPSFPFPPAPAPPIGSPLPLRVPQSIHQGPSPYQGPQLHQGPPPYQGPPPHLMPAAHSAAPAVPFQAAAPGQVPPQAWPVPITPAPAAKPRVGWHQPLGSPARFVAAALLLVIAITQLLVIEDQFERALYLGGLFAVTAIGALVLAVLLARRDSRLVWLCCGLVAESGVAVYLLGRTVGLPEVTDDIGHWTQPVTLLSVIVETGVFLLTGWAISQDGPTSRWVGSRVPLVSGLVALQIGGAATFAAASMPQDAAAAATGVHAGLHASADTAGYWSAVGGAAFHPTGVTRTYYIAADEVVWDYAPTGKNGITGQAFDETADTYVKTGPGRIGSKYLKCLYRGYTDATFGTPQQRPADQAYLGIYGPVIRATVGDTIKVIFRNNCSISASVHPHGVFYQKASEGAPYADNTSGKDKLDDAVPKGSSHTYTWLVPDRARTTGRR